MYFCGGQKYIPFLFNVDTYQLASTEADSKIRNVFTQAKKMYLASIIFLHVFNYRLMYKYCFLFESVYVYK